MLLYTLTFPALQHAPPAKSCVCAPVMQELMKSTKVQILGELRMHGAAN